MRLACAASALLLRGFHVGICGVHVGLSGEGLTQRFVHFLLGHQAGFLLGYGGQVVGVLLLHPASCVDARYQFPAVAPPVDRRL